MRTGDVCTTLAFTVLAPRLEPTLRQLVDMLARPRFDAAAFESVKKRQLAEISAALDEPRLVAAAQLRQRLYGELPAARAPRTRRHSVSQRAHGRRREEVLCSALCAPGRHLRVGGGGHG